MEDEINLLDYLDIIKRQWKIIAITVVISLVFSMIYIASKKPVYEARATIIIRGGGQGSDIGKALGLQVGSSTLVEMNEFLSAREVQNTVNTVLKELLNSRVVTSDVEKEFDPEERTGKMESIIRGSFLDIKVKSRDAETAADMANAYVKALQDYWNKLNLSAAQKKKEYVEEQIPVVAKKLQAAENKLKGMTYMMGPNVVSGSDSIEIERLKREVEIQSSVYLMLRKEYENTRLEEVKEISPFSDVEKAEVPTSPKKVKKIKNLIIGGIIGLFAGIFFAFAKEYVEKLNKARA